MVTRRELSERIDNWFKRKHEPMTRTSQAHQEKKKLWESIPDELLPVVELQKMLMEVSMQYDALCKKYKDKKIRELEEKEFGSVAKEASPYLKPLLSYPENADANVFYCGKSLFIEAKAGLYGEVKFYENKMPISEFLHMWSHEVFHLDECNESFAEFYSLQFLEKMNEVFPNRGCDLEAVKIKIGAIGHPFAYQRRKGIEGNYKNMLKRLLIGQKSKKIIEKELREMDLSESVVDRIIRWTYPGLVVRTWRYLSAKMGGNDMRGPYTIGLHRIMKQKNLFE
jgi:hypothetical protein